MIEIPLLPIPNQTFSIDLGGFSWDIRIKQNENALVTEITRDGVPVASGIRAGAAVLLMPYYRQYYKSGNFIFWNPEYEYPDYTKFGVSHFLFYLSPEEIEALYPVNTTYTVDSIIPNAETVYYLLENGQRFELQDNGAFLLEESKDI